MLADALKVVPCPSERVDEALALALCELTAEQRAVVACDLDRSLRGRVGSDAAAVVGLWIAEQADRLCGAAWVQRQPGHTAIYWPPQTCDDCPAGAVDRLNECAARWLDRQRIGMTQAVFAHREAAPIPGLEAIGFAHIADLLYLACETTADAAPVAPALQFEEFTASRQERLEKLLERTYENTQDCTAMNGKRPLGEVLEGYRATGDVGAEHWWLVRAEGRDVGVLLLAHHQQAEYFELIYMGLVASARGNGWGGQIVRYAQRVAAAAGVERLVLAVDAANRPALAMYRDAGFFAWDRRSVYVRFRGD